MLHVGLCKQRSGGLVLVIPRWNTNFQSRELRSFVTNDSTWPIDDLAIGGDNVSPVVRGTIVASLTLEVQPAKVSGERIGVEELGDQVLRVLVDDAIRGGVLQLGDDYILIGGGTR